MQIDKVNRQFILNDYILTIQQIYNDIQYIKPLFSYDEFFRKLNDDFILIQNKYNKQYSNILNKFIIGNKYSYDFAYDRYANLTFLGAIHFESNDPILYGNIFFFDLKSIIKKNDYCTIRLDNLYLIKDKNENR